MSGRRVREVRALISVEAKERTAETAREFSAYCRQLGDAFDTLNVPDERKVQMLSAVRIKVFAHSDGSLKLKTNLVPSSK